MNSDRMLVPRAYRIEALILLVNALDRICREPHLIVK